MSSRTSKTAWSSNVSEANVSHGETRLKPLLGSDAESSDVTTAQGLREPSTVSQVSVMHIHALTGCAVAACEYTKC